MRGTNETLGLRVPAHSAGGGRNGDVGGGAGKEGDRAPSIDDLRQGRGWHVELPWGASIVGRRSTVYEVCY